VTRSPSSNLLSRPTRSSSAAICGPRRARHDVHALFVELGNVVGEVNQHRRRRRERIQRVTAQLHDHAVHGVTPVIGARKSRRDHSRRSRLGWLTGAPLIRLSIELMAISHPVRASTRALTKQRLLPTGSLSVGGSSTTTTKGSSAYVERRRLSADSVVSDGPSRDRRPSPASPDSSRPDVREEQLGVEFLWISGCDDGTTVRTLRRCQPGARNAIGHSWPDRRPRFR